MGNHLRQFVLTIILWVFCLSGCQVIADASARQQQAMQFQQAQQAQATEPAAAPRMEARIHCWDARRDDCGLLVILNALDEDVKLDIRLHVDEGIAFLPDLEVLPAEGGNEGVIARVQLEAGESRQIFFPYQPNTTLSTDPNIPRKLPGAYRTIVLAANSETYELFAQTRVNAYTILNELGEFHLLPSEVEYNAHFKDLFTDGKMGVGYKIVAEGGDRPHRGSLWVRVDSPHDGYLPVVEVMANEAVAFSSDPVWQTTVEQQGAKTLRRFPVMNEGETRLVRFPFELVRNGRLFDGIYTFNVTLTPNGLEDEAESEKIPVGIQVLSDPQYPNERWFTPVSQNAALITPTPNPTEQALLPETPGLYGKGVGGLTWTNAAEAQKLCEELADVRFSEPYPESAWTLSIANYNGTVCEAYLTFAASHAYMSWNEFKDAFDLHNENITSEDDLLVDHEVYLMPESTR